MKTTAAYPTVAALAFACMGCAEKPRTPADDALLRLADSVAPSVAWGECVDMPLQPLADTLVSVCHGVSGDTSVLIARAWGTIVTKVQRTWRPVETGAETTYDSFISELSGRFGRGDEACPSLAWQPGRLWLREGYWIMLVRSPSTDSIRLTFSRGSPLYEMPCPYRDIHGAEP